MIARLELLKLYPVDIEQTLKNVQVKRKRNRNNHLSYDGNNNKTV
jgi:hypothetical protein